MSSPFAALPSNYPWLNFYDLKCCKSCKDVTLCVRIFAISLYCHLNAALANVIVVIYLVNCIFPLEFDEEHCLYMFNSVNFF